MADLFGLFGGGGRAAGDGGADLIDLFGGQQQGQVGRLSFGRGFGESGAAETVEPEPVTTTGAAGRALVNRLGQNLLNIPAATVAPLDQPRTPAQELVRSAEPFGGIPGPVDLLGRGARAVRAITPDISTVRALPNLVTGGPEAFQQGREQILAEDIRQAQEAPVGTAAGNVAGDAATLLALRSPVTRAQAAVARGAAPRSAIGIAQQISAQRAAAQTAELLAEIQRRGGLRAGISDALRSRLVRRLQRGGARIGEAGVEGSALAALNSQDPFESAAAAAGAQAAQSLALDIGRRTFSGGVTSAVAIGAIGIAALQALAPGDIRILSASESSIAKMLSTAAVVGTAAVLGGPRVSSRNVPVLADAITTLPRGALQSMLRELVDADPEVQAVVQRFSENPNSFTETQRNLLARAIRDPKVSIAATVDRLRLR